MQTRLAEEGTVFLDEISETSPALQVRLLRVSQEREVTPVSGSSALKVRARVIAESNRDLDELCAEDLPPRVLLSEQTARILKGRETI